MALRLLAVAYALDGISGERAASFASIDRQTLRELAEEKTILHERIFETPDPELDEVSAWTSVDLCFRQSLL